MRARSQDGIAVMRTDDVPVHVDNHDYTATAEATHLQSNLAIRAALASSIFFPRWLDVPMEEGSRLLPQVDPNLRRWTTCADDLADINPQGESQGANGIAYTAEWNGAPMQRMRSMKMDCPAVKPAQLQPATRYSAERLYRQLARVGFRRVSI